MTLMESILKYYECRKTSSYEEVEIVTRDGKKHWVYQHCDVETQIVDRVFTPRKRFKKASENLSRPVALFAF